MFIIIKYHGVVEKNMAGVFELRHGTFESVSIGWRSSIT